MPRSNLGWLDVFKANALPCEHPPPIPLVLSLALRRSYSLLPFVKGIGAKISGFPPVWALAACALELPENSLVSHRKQV